MWKNLFYKLFIFIWSKICKKYKKNKKQADKLKKKKKYK